MLLKLNLGPQSSSSEPHEDRRSVPILMVGQDAKSGRQCEEYHRHQQQQETTSPSGSIFLNGNVGFTMRDSTVCAKYKENISILTEDETETDESCDQLTEMRVIYQPGSPTSPGASTCGFFWGKKDGKSVMSPNDDESVDAYNPFYL
jgi:hypothetical protein